MAEKNQDMLRDPISCSSEVRSLGAEGGPGTQLQEAVM